ncbi:DUF397 domain-containing protein [Actinoalloteichus hymeniacidonis]|uniref:DUF397 family protein n=1 Tax=Actinoalloteichus hymeniacidonis TaxID=340345 RepID=A0AAC9HLK4_9PSEU|nr:DUF397 domain-containing protein [Actinoalloteichus hymeniacidonis]AOS61115.1 putative DUF397 family protein [Actinoalloteichus hymeniacidonis]MBB5910884.1 hypothetical protein [Actinoalloteichus hymeniacidonis]
MSGKQLSWRKSTRSGTDTNCVEVGLAEDVVGLRDTKNRDGGTLVVSRTRFTALLTAVKTGRLSARR